MMETKGAYPIILRPTDNGYYVDIPDFDVGTQGQTIAEAMEMARDVIGLMGIDFEDDKKELPIPYSKSFEAEKEDIVTLVDIDFSEYRKKVDNRAVKKNCTIPYWLSVEAERAGVNYSRLLQDAIISALGLYNQTITKSL
ncbi:type II toxin-antitoxin system HicB family antitoxin [Lacrimispora xylanisolvens]|uniref:type II toxin-antitoxin system HicB family antitoxin n=1 Tax=Lacrimispora xylanisolvens TaxID=384636 RepID=UPI002402B83A|nr:HicB family protein [Paenibacillaceae bacterium]